jgi:hypothetical protein
LIILAIIKYHIKEIRMDFLSINWLAVLACVVISMVSGSLWYNPKTFFPMWWKGIGKTENDDPGTTNMGVTWALTLLSILVQAVFMSAAVSVTGKLMPGGVTAGSGALTGFLIWVGVIAPTYLVNKLFAGHGLKIWAIEVGNHLVNFVLYGMVFGLWH